MATRRVLVPELGNRTPPPQQNNLEIMKFKSSKIFNNRRSYNFFINEGLIHSYNYDAVKKFLLDKFKNIHSINFAQHHPLNNKGLTMNEAKHFMYISLRKNFSYKEIEKTLNDLCGWYISKAIIYFYDLTLYDNGSKVLRYIEMNNQENGLYNEFEDLYLDEMIEDNGISYKIHSIEFLAQEKFTENVNDIPDFLYHASDVIFFNKIFKNGLVPKNRNNHPERIYFGNSLKIIKQMFYNRYNLVVYKVDTSSIKDNCYADLNHDGCYYTTESIHPKYISILLDDKTWKQLDEIDDLDDIFLLNEQDI